MIKSLPQDPYWMLISVVPGERPYSCSMCHKRFSSSDVLRVHIRTHTGEKPYKCETCKKEFVNKSQLIAHRKSHGAVAASYLCHICFQTFSSSTSLAVHANSCANRMSVMDGISFTYKVQ